MTDTTSPALRTALAYYHAWTNHDFERAMSHVADDIVCDAPAGRLTGAEAFRDFLGPFVQILKSATLIAAFGDEDTALIMYDTATVPVPSAPGAECLTVRNGKIVYDLNGISRPDWKELPPNYTQIGDPRWDGLNPKVVMLMIGTNNLGSHQSVQDTIAGIKCDVAAIHEKLPEAKILLLAIFPRGANSSPQQKILPSSPPRAARSHWASVGSE